MSCCRDDKPMRMTMIHELKATDNSEPVFKLECKGNCEKCRNEKKRKETSSGRKKSAITALFLLLGSFVASAQGSDTASKGFWDDPFNHPLMPLYLTTTIVFITIVLVLVVAIYTLHIMNLFIQQTEKENAQKLGIVYKAKQSWFDKTWQRVNALVPLGEEKSIELDHNFDGIRELDNHLPPWWKFLFYASIVWGAVYMFVYHISDSMPLSLGEYNNELAAAEEKAKIFKASQPAAEIDENTLAYTKDEALITKGQTIFVGNCVACHKNDGGGNTIGPNLTDEYWIHGGGIKNIYSTIKNGVVEKGMPVWGKAMSPQDVKSVAFYVMSLQGTKPQNAKAAQGELYKAIDDKPIEKDSTKAQASLK